MLRKREPYLLASSGPKPAHQPTTGNGDKLSSSQAQPAQLLLIVPAFPLGHLAYPVSTVCVRAKRGEGSRSKQFKEHGNEVNVRSRTCCRNHLAALFHELYEHLPRKVFNREGVISSPTPSFHHHWASQRVNLLT